MNVLNVEKLYFLGPEGTYAQQAMKQFVKSNHIIAAKRISKTPIAAIIKEIDEDKNAIAVLPIENSIEGIVRETIDNIIKIQDSSVKIVAETVIPINHCLLSESKITSEIKVILSHPQALGQCSKYICEHFSNAEILETASTAEAARMAKEKGKGYAAIANSVAAEIFNLNLLAQKINDEKDNKTRFILLARKHCPATKNDKTSIFFAVKNEPGSLVNVLNVFHKYNINLIYIESRPSRKKMGEYNFCVDLEGHVTDENIKKALNSLEKITSKTILIGSYPRFEK